MINLLFMWTMPSFTHIYIYIYIFFFFYSAILLFNGGTVAA